MQVYDLDKTQEWLNRTLAINKEPPIRGGAKPDHRHRRTTAVSLCATSLILLLGIGTGVFLRASSPRPVVIPAKTEGAIVRQAREGETATTVKRDAHIPSPVRPAVVTRPAEYRAPLDAPDLSTPNLDGDLRSLPGHTAPPAPVFLDGPSGSGLFR